ncbi:MAG: transcriptional regulator, partial [Acidobacteriota bacterium]
MAERDEAATSSAANPDPDPPSSDAGHRLDRFRLADGWQVDPSLNRLDGPSGSASLHPKAMEVLVVLASRDGEVVSKDEVLAAVWPGTFVSDQVLANAVWELRRAFGDDARSPRFIQTVPKRGYRLLAEVLPEAPPTRSPESTESPEPAGASTATPASEATFRDR